MNSDTPRESQGATCFLEFRYVKKSGGGYGKEAEVRNLFFGSGVARKQRNNSEEKLASYLKKTQLKCQQKVAVFCNNVNKKAVAFRKKPTQSRSVSQHIPTKKRSFAIMTTKSSSVSQKTNKKAAVFRNMAASVFTVAFVSQCLVL